MIDVTVVGNALFDHEARADRLPERGTVRGTAFRAGPAGRGVNQACIARRLGASSALVARVGGDARGEAIVARLRAEGVDDSCVVVDEAVPTGVASIHVDEQGHRRVVAIPGASERLVRDDAARAWVLRDARVVVISLEVPLDAALGAARIARAHGARVILDPAPGVDPPDGLLPLVDVVKPNAQEAECLTGVAVVDKASARRAAEILLRRGVAAVMIDTGGRGNLVVADGLDLFLPHLEIPAVDSTGAGDAMVAGLAVMMAEGHPLDESARFAHAAAALETTGLGATRGISGRAAVLALLHQAVVH